MAKASRPTSICFFIIIIIKSYDTSQKSDINSYYLYTSVDCPVPKPQCTENEELVNGNCECKPGYNRDSDGSPLGDDYVIKNTCSPKKQCPPPMKYFLY